jgi:hypothetical protein
MQQLAIKRGRRAQVQMAPRLETRELLTKWKQKADEVEVRSKHTRPIPYLTQPPVHRLERRRNRRANSPAKRGR